MAILHHNVYVIELSPEVLKDNKFISDNLDCDRALPCFYVGVTGLTPEERFGNHKRGYKHSKIVKQYGMRLVPEIFEQYNPMLYKDAETKERTLAIELRLKGHGVWQK